MTLGTVNGWNVYIVHADSDISATKTFLDYTNYVYAYKTIGTINKIGILEMQFIDNPNDLTESVDLVRGNLIYIVVNQKLLGKFVINKPVRVSDGYIHVTGEQSTGTQKKYRKISQETMPKIKYENQITCDILKSTTSGSQGILVDSSNNPIISINTTYCGSVSDRYTLQYDNENRIDGLSKLAQTTNQEWWIDHGTNSLTNPFSEGDTLCMADRAGSPTFTYHFHLTGSDQNAQISDGAEEIETQINEIKVTGIDQNSNQIISTVADVTSNYTPITTGQAPDGWLASDMTSTQMYIEYTEGSLYSLRMAGIGPTPSDNIGIVMIDNEKFEIYYVDTVLNRLLISPGSRPALGTEATPHRKGADIIYLTEIFVGGSPSSHMQVYVDNVDCICNVLGTTFCIGTDCFHLQGKAVNYLCATRHSTVAYAHGDKVYVKNGNWSESHPDDKLNFYGLLMDPTGLQITDIMTGSCACAYNVSMSNNYINICCPTGNFLSNAIPTIYTISGGIPGVQVGCLCMDWQPTSIMEGGLFSKTISENAPKTHHNLDLVTQGILKNKKLPITRITLNVMDPIEVWQSVNLGDNIRIFDGEIIGFLPDQEVRITSFEFVYNAGEISLSLTCNDSNVRVYPSTPDNYSVEKNNAEKPKQQDATRKFAEYQSTSGTDSTPTCQTLSFGLKQLKCVGSPIDDFDASNKKYVDASVGGSSPWCVSGTCIRPIDPYIDCDVYVRQKIHVDCAVEIISGYLLAHDVCALCGHFNNLQSISGGGIAVNDALVPLVGGTQNVGSSVIPWGSGAFNSLYVDHISGVGLISTPVIDIIASTYCGGNYYGNGSNLTGVVNTLNSLSGAVNLVAGLNITITPAGQNLTIASTGGGTNCWQTGANPSYITPCNTKYICANQISSPAGIIDGQYVTASSCMCTPSLSFFCSCNTIWDTTTVGLLSDLCFRSKTGMYFSTMIALGGMVLNTNFCTFRPCVDCTTGTVCQDLGMTNFPWRNIYSSGTSYLGTVCSLDSVCVTGSGLICGTVARATNICATQCVIAQYICASNKVTTPCIEFTNNVSNRIFDSSTDLTVCGRCGIYSAICDPSSTCSGGFVFNDATHPCSICTVRPYTTNVTDLGASFAKWRGLHLRDNCQFGPYTVNASSGCLIGLTVACAGPSASCTCAFYISSRGNDWASVCMVSVRGWGWQATNCICVWVQNADVSSRCIYLDVLALSRC